MIKQQQGQQYINNNPENTFSQFQNNQSQLQDQALANNQNQVNQNFQFSFAPQQITQSNQNQSLSHNKSNASIKLNQTNQHSFISYLNEKHNNNNRKVKTQPSERNEEDQMQQIIQQQLEYYKKKNLNLTECALKQIEQCSKNQIFKNENTKVQKKIYNQKLTTKLYNNLEQQSKKNKKKLKYDYIDAAHIYSTGNLVQRSVKHDQIKKSSQANSVQNDQNTSQIDQLDIYEKEQNLIVQKIFNQQNEKRLARKQSNQTQSVHSFSYEKKIKPLFDRSSKDTSLIEHTSYYIWRGAIHRRVSKSAKPYSIDNNMFQDSSQKQLHKKKSSEQRLDSYGDKFSSTKSTQLFHQNSKFVDCPDVLDSTSNCNINNNSQIIKLPKLGTSQFNPPIKSQRSIRSITQVKNTKQPIKTSMKDSNQRGSKSLDKNNNVKGRVNKNFRQINQLEDQNDFSDFIFTVTKNNKENFLQATIKYGFTKEMKILNTNINIFKSQCLNTNNNSSSNVVIGGSNFNVDINWSFDEIWSTKKDKLLANQLLDVKSIKGKNESLKIQAIYQIISCSLENIYTTNELQPYLKDIAITHYLNKMFERQKEHNPGPLILSNPCLLQKQRENYCLVYEREYCSTLESILEYRFTISKNWEEAELLNNFYQILHAMNELSKYDICHGNISPDNIVFSYLTQRYKLINFSYANAYSSIMSTASYSSTYKKCSYHYYPVPPFVAPEMKFKYQFEQKVKHQYDPLASDMYCLGICMLFMKYITPQHKRSGDCIQVRLASLVQDNSLSSKIIQKLINMHPIQRVQSCSYGELCQSIHDYLVQQNNFRQWQITISNQIRLLNPLDKFKYQFSREPEDLAEYYYSTHQWQKALEKYKWVMESLNNDTKEEEKNNQQQQQQQQINIQLLVLKRTWKCHYRLNQLEEAYTKSQQYFIFVQEKLQSQILSNPLEYADDYHEAAIMKWQANHREEAIKDFELSIYYLKHQFSSDNFEILQNLNNLGVLYWQLKIYDKSQQSFNEVITQMKKNHQQQDDLYLAAIDNLANIHKDLQQLEASIVLMQEQYKIRSEKEGDGQMSTISILGKIGQLYFQLNDLINAKRYLQLTLKKRQILAIPDDQQIIKWRQIYANVLFRLGEKEPAMQILNSTLVDLKNNAQKAQSSDPTHILINIADFVQDTGNTQESLKFYAEALKLAKSNLGAQNELIKNLNDKVGMLEKAEKNQNSDQKQIINNIN